MGLIVTAGVQQKQAPPRGGAGQRGCVADDPAASAKFEEIRAEHGQSQQESGKSESVSLLQLAAMIGKQEILVHCVGLPAEPVHAARDKGETQQPEGRGRDRYTSATADAPGG